MKLIEHLRLIKMGQKVVPEYQINHKNVISTSEKQSLVKLVGITENMYENASNGLNYLIWLPPLIELQKEGLEEQGFKYNDEKNEVTDLIIGHRISW